MSLVVDYASAFMTAPQSRFPFVQKPFYTHTDYPWQNGVIVWRRNEDFISDYDGQYIYPAPISVYHDQGGGYGYDGDDPGPSVGWVNFGNIPFSFRTNKPHGFTEFSLTQNPSDADYGLFDARAEVACMGATFLWSRTDQEAGDTLDPSAKKFTTFRVGVGWGDDRVLYSVRYLGQGEVKIAKSYDQGYTWIELENLRQKGEYEAAWGIPNESGTAGTGSSSGTGSSGPKEAPRDMNYLEFRLIAGRMMIWTGSNGPYVYDEHRINADGGNIITINQLVIRAYKFTSFACSGHPTKWKTQCIYDSPDIPTGFYSETLQQPYIDPAGIVPSGWYANVYELYPGSLYGPIVNFRLVVGGPINGYYNGEPYSDFCAAVRAVSLFWSPKIYFNPANPITTYPEEITVTHEFDMETLQINSGGALVFNNNRIRSLGPWGYGTFGEWLRNTGQVAMDVWMTRTTPTGSVPGAIRTFAGYANTLGEISAEYDGSYFTMHMADRKRQLQNPRFALPWLDGWNVYYAIAYLAQLGGVDISDMTFSQYVPNVPFGPGSDLGSPEGGSYYLPVGDAGSVLTRFSGANVWEVISKIAYAIGYMVFFDANGQLQFRKFKMPNGLKRSFYESDRDSANYQSGGGLEGCWSMSVIKDMDEVRNISITIGMNAFTKYEPIVYKWIDGDSIYTPTAFNHLGYENPAVWMDSQFGNENFAYLASYQMFRFLRTPGYKVSFTTWLQPDIFPLDMIGVQSAKLGTYGIRFMVTSVQHHVDKNRGHSTITARYIPDF